MQLNFDARQFSPASVDGGAEQLPVSDHLGHPVVITSDELVEAKNSPKDAQGNAQNKFLALNLQVIDGPHKGAKGTYRLNILNASPQAAEIAAKQLSAICHAIGSFQVGNSAELYNKPFRVVVEQQADPKYTQIKGVLTLQGIDPGNPNAGPRQASAVVAVTAQAQPAAVAFTAPPPGSSFAQPATTQQAQQVQQQPAAIDVPWSPTGGAATPPPPWGPQK